MKFKIELCGTTLLLDYKQLNALTKLLEDVERIEEKYVGSNKGPNGASYLKLIRTYQPMDHFRFTGMTDEEYGALQLVTKLEDEKQ